MAEILVEQYRNENQLWLDQSELGSKKPDGGYGWIILAVASFFQILIPSLSVGYGTIILFLNLENGISTNPRLWDMNATYAPLFFIISWTFTDFWCRKFILDSTWPRLVSVAATCLISAGLLIMWIAVNNRENTILYVMAGSVSGLGASLLLSQIEIIITQYFQSRLQIARIILQIFTAVGFVVTPIALGYSIRSIGILKSISWYQAIILQGLIVSIAFKKPEYLKLHRSRYNLIRRIADEEEDIFTKNAIELQRPRAVLQENSKTATNGSDLSNNNQAQSLQYELRKAGWEAFNENKSSNNHEKLNAAFAVQNNTNKLNSFKDNYVETPQPLFMETHFNNNVSYSYEQSPIEIDNPVVFITVENTSNTVCFQYLQCFKDLTFYKTLFFVVTLKYSTFIFWALFPSYMYITLDHLKVHNAVIIVGFISLGGLFFSIILIWKKTISNVELVLLYWSSTAGLLFISDSSTDVFIISGAILISLNIILSLRMAQTTFINYISAEQKWSYLFITKLTTVCLVSLLGIDLSYQTCFLMLAIFHFLAGSLYFVGLIKKRIKSHRSHR